MCPIRLCVAKKTLIRLYYYLLVSMLKTHGKFKPSMSLCIEVGNAKIGCIIV